MFRHRLPPERSWPAASDARPHSPPRAEAEADPRHRALNPPSRRYGGVSVALAVLLAVFGSNWSACVTVAVLICVPALATSAMHLSVCEPPGTTRPTSQMPVLKVNVPCEGVAAKNVSPGDIWSVT